MVFFFFTFSSLTQFCVVIVGPLLISRFTKMTVFLTILIVKAVLLNEHSSGKKKAHKHKLFGPVALGTTLGMSWGQTQVFSLFYTMEAQFVPGTNKPSLSLRGPRAAERVYVLKVYVPSSLPDSVFTGSLFTGSSWNRISLCRAIFRPMDLTVLKRLRWRKRLWIAMP